MACMPIMMVYSYIFLMLFRLNSKCLYWKMNADPLKMKKGNKHCRAACTDNCLFLSSCCHLTIQPSQEYITCTPEEIKSMELNCEELFPAEQQQSNPGYSIRNLLGFEIWMRLQLLPLSCTSFHLETFQDDEVIRFLNQDFNLEYTWLYMPYANIKV